MGCVLGLVLSVLGSGLTCFGIMLGLFCYCSGIRLGLLWNCLWIVVGLHGDCVAVFGDCSFIVLGWIVLGPSRHCVGIVLGLRP